MRNLAFVLVAALAISCGKPAEKSTASSGKLNGVQKYYYPDGALYMEVTFKDSVPDGPSRQYFKNGQVFEESNYVNGVRHGLMKTFYEDGKVSAETP